MWPFGVLDVYHVIVIVFSELYCLYMVLMMSTLVFLQY